jgi:hypothetical protein
MIRFLLRLAPSRKSLLSRASELQNWVYIARGFVDTAIEAGFKYLIEHVRELTSSASKRPWPAISAGAGSS